MAIVASPPNAPHQANKPQKNLLRSISKFLSGGKSRPRVCTSQQQEARAPTSQNKPTSSSPSPAPQLAPLPAANAPIGPISLNSQTSESINSSVVNEDDANSERRLASAIRDSTAHEAISTRQLGAQDAGKIEAEEEELGADEDASIRPITPSSLIAPSIISTNSFAQTHRTFKSDTSTKPTTVFSVDSTAGANRIAVVPGTGTNLGSNTPGQLNLPHSISDRSSVGSPLAAGPPITFSAIPTGEETPSGASTPNNEAEIATAASSQVPRHTLAHPRNNPHPTAIPFDNASMITLASSSFAPSLLSSRPGPQAAAGNSYGGGGLASLRALKHEADDEASTRALAPSRRASDESLGGRSTWSAAVGRSLRGGKEGAPSIRTMGTSGTGGELLQADEHENFSDSKRESNLVGETDAQRVVRDEGTREETPVQSNDVIDTNNEPMPPPPAFIKRDSVGAESVATSFAGYETTAEETDAGSFVDASSDIAIK